MKHFNFLFMSLLLITPAFADQAADQETFKRLYAEFNDLYENSPAIDPVIEVAESLYRIAPFAYGTDSQQYALVTYNLASLYDEKGGEGKSSLVFQNNSATKAINLYKLYFIRLEKLNTDYAQAHIDQYLKYITADANYNNFRSNDGPSRELLTIAQSIELPASEVAKLCLTLGGLRTQAKHREQSKYFYQTAYDIMKNAGEEGHELFGRSAQLLAGFENSSGNRAGAVSHYLEAISVFSAQNEKNIEKLTILYGDLSRLYMAMGNESDAKIYNEKLAQLSDLPE